MATDRPDTTETPITVDAGHLQIEFSIIDYVRDGELESIAVMPTNLRIGVLNDVEFAIVLTPYLHSEFENGPGVITTDSGFGDIDLRLKINLWGNDDGRTAFAVMPFITLPTASDMLGHGHVEGGIVFPFAMELDEEWSLGLMAEFDAVYDPSRAEYDLEFLHTAALGRSIVGELGGYIEYIGIASTAPESEYQILLGTGLTYAVNPNWQLDAGVNIGLAGGAPDLNPFVGMSLRF